MRYTKSELYNPDSKQAACVGANGVCPAQLGLAKADSVLNLSRGEPGTNCEICGQPELFELFESVAHVHQVVVKDFKGRIKHLKEGGVAHGIKDKIALLTADSISPRKIGELIRELVGLGGCSVGDHPISPDI